MKEEELRGLLEATKAGALSVQGLEEALEAEGLRPWDKPGGTAAAVAALAAFKGEVPRVTQQQFLDAWERFPNDGPMQVWLRYENRAADHPEREFELIDYRVAPQGRGLSTEVELVVAMAQGTLESLTRPLWLRGLQEQRVRPITRLTLLVRDGDGPDSKPLPLPGGARKAVEQLRFLPLESVEALIRNLQYPTGLLESWRWVWVETKVEERGGPGLLYIDQAAPATLRPQWLELYARLLLGEE